MRRHSRPLILSLAALLLLAACAEKPKRGDATPTGTIGGDSGGQVLTPQATDPKRQEAIESCYRYADAQVRAAQQIDQDIGQRDSTMGFGGGYKSFQNQMDPYAYRQQRQELYERCMRSQGYGASE